MRTLVFLFVIALTASAMAEVPLSVEFKQATDNCMKSTGVDKNLVIRARNTDFAEDETLMKYYFCVHKEMGIQNADGTFNSDAIIKKNPVVDMSKEENTKMVEKCIKTDITNPVKDGYDVAKCLISTLNDFVNKA